MRNNTAESYVAERITNMLMELSLANTVSRE